jgi:hypothetical protein
LRKLRILCRDLLRRVLTPSAFDVVRFCWWRVSFYYPRLVISRFTKRTPVVFGFGGRDGASYLVNKLQSVNVLAPTVMCKVMTKCGSDKGAGWHNYTTLYSALFEEYLDRPLRILELGLGTNNPKVPFNMSILGHPGASVRGWRDLFPSAFVYGADIDRNILFHEDRIKTFYCNQLDQAAIRDLWAQPDLQGGADIIIEDGLHTFEANISFMEGSLDHLRPGGIFIIEDIERKWNKRWLEVLESNYSKCRPDYEFALVDLPNSLNDYWNNLLVIRRKD